MNDPDANGTLANCLAPLRRGRDTGASVQPTSLLNCRGAFAVAREMPTSAADVG